MSDDPNTPEPSGSTVIQDSTTSSAEISGPWLEPGLRLWDGEQWVRLEDRVEQLVDAALRQRVAETILAMDEAGRDQIRVLLDALAERGL